MRNSFDVGCRRGSSALGPCSARNRRLAAAASAPDEQLGLSAIGLSINSEVVKGFDSSIVIFLVFSSGIEIWSQRCVGAESLDPVDIAVALRSLLAEIDFVFTAQ